MSSQSDGSRTIIHVTCDPDLKRDVRIAAAAEGMSMSEYVRTRLRSAANDDTPIDA